MAAKASSLSVQADLQTVGRLRRAAARMLSADDARGGMLATMRASARRPRAAHTAAARPRKAKRAKRMRNLGGRLAAAMRIARLRACRAAEDHRGARR